MSIAVSVQNNSFLNEEEEAGRGKSVCLGGGGRDRMIERVASDSSIGIALGVLQGGSGLDPQLRHLVEASGDKLTNSNTD